MKEYYRSFFLFIVAITVVLVLFILRRESLGTDSAVQKTEKVQPEAKAAIADSGNNTPPTAHTVITQSLPDPFDGATRNKTATLCIRSQIRTNGWQDAPEVLLEKDRSLSLKADTIAGASVRWYQIFPDITQRYNNAYWPNEPKAYQWKGVDKISYLREEILDFRNQWTVSLYKDNRFQYRLPKNMITRSRFFNPSAGSFWYQVEILKDGQIFRSPGIEESTEQGLSADVFRLTLCLDKADYINHLTGFFNVPGIFGSTIRQSSHYIGVDCADVLMAAYAKWKKLPNEKNYNVAMLVNKFPKASEFNLQNGDPDTAILWGKHVRVGDFIAVRYKGARSYQHIGALYSDRNKDGSLDASDLVIHAGPDPLHLSALKSGNFNGHVVILRSK
ncbi:MAG: hypothetical protein ABFR90_12355 [Planctomycetota bacterium]